MYLVDTNIFLEILLGQSKSGNCKDFLNNNINELAITDFSLHSIGVILFREGAANLFNTFIDDVLPAIKIVTLHKHEYKSIVKHSYSRQLDFDDAYQYTICNFYDYKLVTMDNDFKNIEEIDVHFL